MDLLAAYRLLWTLAPLIFGLAFACWLTAIFDPGVAGVALILLAFKVFPDTGLHHLVPSNLDHGPGRGPLGPHHLLPGLGPLVPVPRFPGHRDHASHRGHLRGHGRSPGPAAGRPGQAPPSPGGGGAVVACIVVVFLVAYFVKRPDFVLPPLLPHGDHPFWREVKGIGMNILQIMVENVRLSEALWGLPAIFCGALVYGYATLSQATRRVVRSMFLIYAVVLGGFMFYVSNHPADVLFRLWIPLVVLLFGLVAKAICFTWTW